MALSFSLSQSNNNICVVKMNSAMKAAALINSKASCFHLRTALFHSTPPLDRKRRIFWESVSISPSHCIYLYLFYMDLFFVLIWLYVKDLEFNFSVLEKYS